MLSSHVASNKLFPRFPDICSHLLCTILDKLQEGKSTISSKVNFYKFQTIQFDGEKFIPTVLGTSIIIIQEESIRTFREERDAISEVSNTGNIAIEDELQKLN